MDGGYSKVTQIKYMEKLKEVAPGGLSDGMVSFLPGGSGSTEAAIKTIRSYSGRRVMLTCYGSYIGGYIGGLSLTADVSGVRRGLSPFIPDIAYVPFPYCYRCIFSQEYPDCGLSCVNHLKYVLDTVAHPMDTAAFFAEPIQTHGGVVVPPVEYFTKIREILDEHQILLVADEIVTGFGRTGKMFGMENYAVDADMMTLGKPIAGGLPLGAIVAQGEVGKYIKGGSSASGNPVSCAAALAMIEVIQREKLLQNALKIGGHMIKRLKEMQEKYEVIGDVRGSGLLIGVELVKDRKEKTPAHAQEFVIRNAYRKGLILRCGGTYHQVLRITPPLNITIEQVDIGLNILDEAFSEVKI
jgi:4-aminobutyrate aminotransferase-like enzyme